MQTVAPAVSVVIPVRNERSGIPLLLRSLASQTLPPAEVVIVDAGSTDGTPDEIDTWVEANPFGKRLRIVRLAEATPGTARNAGVEVSASDWIAFTDAGMEVEPQWLEELVQAQAAHAADVVYGNVEPRVTGFWEECCALSYVPCRRTTPAGALRGPCIPSSLMRRSAWERVGGFPDLRAAEDLQFMEEIERLKIRVGWAPKATVHWDLQRTPGALWRKFTLYSRHNVWAGRQKQWHYGIARKYLVALPFFALGALVHPFWLVLPVAGHAVRTLLSIWRRRDGRSALFALRPDRGLGVAAALLIIDAATFVGWMQASLRPRRVAPVAGLEQVGASRQG